MKRSAGDARHAFQTMYFESKVVLIHDWLLAVEYHREQEGGEMCETMLGEDVNVQL